MAKKQLKIVGFSLKKVIFILLTTTLLPSLFFVIYNQTGFLEKNKKESFKIRPLYCERDKPFTIEPEFNRALNLIDRENGRGERFNFNTSTLGEYSLYFHALDLRNCLNITYSDRHDDIDKMNAWFDPGNSTRNNLIIKVNREYQNKNIDDLSLAMLLAHELTHVQQFFAIRYHGREMTCLDQESEAFISQLKFLAILEEHERERLTTIMKNNYNMHGILYDLWIEQDKALLTCDDIHGKNAFGQEEYNLCFWEEMESITAAFIQDHPGYREACTTPKDV